MLALNARLHQAVEDSEALLERRRLALDSSKRVRSACTSLLYCILLHVREHIQRSVHRSTSIQVHEYTGCPTYALAYRISFDPVI